MDIKLLRKKAKQLWNIDGVSTEINKSNQRKWLASVINLGDKWLYAKHIEKKSRD